MPLHFPYYLQSTPGIKPQHALTSHKIFENATLLIAKLKEKVGEDSEPVVKVTGNFQTKIELEFILITNICG